ncbi:YtxH domain-containing protein [Paenibacillus sp. sgz302251]|uniref:YtxH domain-containing protein n=1 Tax=Paenibacillus sp. sgz302251 TaxID=3414493 RepID=UPI003C7B2C1D
MSEQQSSNGILLGAIVGGAIGAVTALLLAPKSGSALREDLASTCQTLTQKTKEIACTIGQNTKDIASTIGQTTNNLATTVKEEAADLVDHAKQSNQNIMSAASSSKEDVKKDLTDTSGSSI